MQKDIISIFNEGTSQDFPLEDVRGGSCPVNISTCATGEGKCNVNSTCSSNSVQTRPGGGVK
jgi:hypothetical protein